MTSTDALPGYKPETEETPAEVDLNPVVK